MAPSVRECWRRIANEAPLYPGDYAAMLAIRAEAQVAAEWMAMPISRNLHGRYAVLHSAFITGKQKVALGEALTHNLECLFQATKKSGNGLLAIKRWLMVTSGTFMTTSGLSCDGLTVEETTVLLAYLNTTSCIAGCQAIRRRIVHCCFGFRVVHGECIFLGVSPNR